MLKRRTITTLIGAVPLIASYGRSQRAWGQSSSSAVALVKTTSDELVTIVNAAASREDKRRRLQQVIDNTVAIEDLGRFCLGRFRRSPRPTSAPNTWLASRR